MMMARQQVVYRNVVFCFGKNKIHTCKPTFGGREKCYTKQKVFPAVRSNVWHFGYMGHTAVRGWNRFIVSTHIMYVHILCAYGHQFPWGWYISVELIWTGTIYVYCARTRITHNLPLVCAVRSEYNVFKAIFLCVMSSFCIHYYTLCNSIQHCLYYCVYFIFFLVFCYRRYMLKCHFIDVAFLLFSGAFWRWFEGFCWYSYSLTVCNIDRTLFKFCLKFCFIYHYNFNERLFSKRIFLVQAHRTCTMHVDNYNCI